MEKINTIINDGSIKQSKKQMQGPDVNKVNDKNIRIIANIVKGIREARKELSNGK
jgi:hypothetical protein